MNTKAWRELAKRARKDNRVSVHDLSDTINAACDALDAREGELEEVRKALGVGVITEEVSSDGSKIKILHDAYYDLGGAIEDIEHHPVGHHHPQDASRGHVCDDVSLRTLRRVEERLGKASRILTRPSEAT